MKTRFKHICLMLLAVFTLMSCGKDQGTLPDSSKSGELLLIEEKLNGKTLHKYEYLDNNLLSRWTVIAVEGDPHYTNFSYDHRGRMILCKHRSNGKVYLSESYTYSNNDDRPISGAWAVDDDDPENDIYIQYTYSKNLVMETMTYPDGITTSFPYTFDDNGNLKSAIIGPAFMEHNDYDNTPGVYRNHPFPWKLNFNNNYKSVKTTVNGALVNDHIYEYTYNKQGYAEKALVYDRKSKSLLETREYFYKKAN